MSFFTSHQCNEQSEANPMNWKHGGSMKDHNGIRYTITPESTRPPPPKKPVGYRIFIYHLWGYEWYVQGGGFASSDYGERLLKEVKGCGAVTGWQFSYKEDDPIGDTEWWAAGTLPLFIRSGCFERAIKSAGGFDDT